MEIAVDINSLVSDAANGSSRAFAELVRIHQSNIRKFLARFAVDASTVDDLAQEVFISAYRQLGEFEESSTFSTWLHGIAKNKALTFLRAEGRRKAREKNVFEAALLEWQASWLANEPGDEQACYLDWLDECVNELTPNGKQIIRQFYYQGKSTDEVGEQLNKGGGAVRMMLVRIRRALLKCLTKKKDHLKKGN